MIKNLITKQNETNDKKTSFECQFNVDYAIPERERERGRVRNLSNTVDYLLEFLRSGHS